MCIPREAEVDSLTLTRTNQKNKKKGRKKERKKEKHEMHRHRRTLSGEFQFYVDSDNEETTTGTTTMKCVSCREEYKPLDAGTCRECYEEASETEEELKREIEDLKAKVSFLRFWSPLDHHRSTSLCFSDVVLVAYEDESGRPVANPVPVPAHKAVLVSMLFNQTVSVHL